MIMKRVLLSLLLLCGLTFAMVPRSRFPRETSTRRICAEQTPCSWIIYDRVTKVVQGEVINTYCQCPEGTTCTQKDNDPDMSTYVFKCL